jgi:hypothetical protein
MVLDGIRGNWSDPLQFDFLHFLLHLSMAETNMPDGGVKVYQSG